MPPPQAAKNIGKNIRAARISAGFTRSQLAAAMGYKGKGANAQIFKLEEGYREPYLRKIFKIADILGVPAEALMQKNGYSSPLRRVRESKGLTQLELAHAIGHRGKEQGSSFISQIERGQRVPRLSTMQRIAAALDTPVDRLILGPEAVDRRPAKGGKK